MGETKEEPTIPPVGVRDDPDYPESMRLFHYVRLPIQTVNIKGSVPDVGHIYPFKNVARGFSLAEKGDPEGSRY